jgi:hypothetical protein
VPLAFGKLGKKDQTAGFIVVGVMIVALVLFSAAAGQVAWDTSDWKARGRAAIASRDPEQALIFHRFNLEWKTRILRVFTQAAWGMRSSIPSEIDEDGKDVPVDTADVERSRS